MISRREASMHVIILLNEAILQIIVTETIISTECFHFFIKFYGRSVN